MGYAGKLEEKLKAQELRKNGYSYAEIQRCVSVAKSTISLWCRDIELTSEQMQALYERSSAEQRKGSVVSARNKQIMRWGEEKRLRELGVKEIGELNKRQKFLIGVALYAAEGSKTGRSEIAFSNADPKMIKFMVDWFRKFCKVPGPKFRGALWIHEALDEPGAKNFWSNLTGIPLNQFRKSYIAKNKVGSKKIRKQKHEYGVFSVRFTDTQLKRRITGWIDGLLIG